MTSPRKSNPTRTEVRRHQKGHRNAHDCIVILLHDTYHIYHQGTRQSMRVVIRKGVATRCGTTVKTPARVIVRRRDLEAAPQARKFCGF